MTTEQQTAPGARRPRRTQTIDFTRPTKFTADHERRLRATLSTFCRTASTRLSAELRLPIELEVEAASQQTWANAHEQLPGSALCAVVELRPTRTRMLLAADVGFALAAIESLLGGAPAGRQRERRLTEIDLALAEHLFEGLLAQLTVVWSDLAGVELALVGVDTPMDTAQVAAVSEPTLALPVEARVHGDAHRLTLLVPHRAIAPVEDRILGRRADGDEAPTEEVRGRLRDALAGVEVSLGAEIAGLELPAARVLSLSPGDTLALGAPVDAGVGLCAEGVRVLRATPGRSGSRRAAQVLESIEPAAVESLARLAAATAVADGGDAPAPAAPDAALSRSLGTVPVRIWAELGRARLTAGAVVGLAPGAVVELDRRVDDPIDLYVNGLRFASGALLVVDGTEWAVRIDAVTGLAAESVQRA